MEATIELIKLLKQRILSSRYLVAKIANAESLRLYFTIGHDLDLQIAQNAWGDKILDAVADRLQQEIPGLRGFSASNLKKMRIFHNAWKSYLAISSSLTDKFDVYNFEISSSLTNQNKDANFTAFVSIGFTHHIEIILKTIMVNDDTDERELEREIVLNIKKFLMSLGNDFSFIGNQYRMMVGEDEYFIDLLFFHRGLQSLVAFELKRGKFKPEYIGKMNFYLSALDDLVRKPHENLSIGIILCKEKDQKKVKYSFRDVSKPLGVATYKTSETLPPELRNALPDAETLKKLME